MSNQLFLNGDEFTTKITNFKCDGLKLPPLSVDEFYYGVLTVSVSEFEKVLIFNLDNDGKFYLGFGTSLLPTTIFREINLSFVGGSGVSQGDSTCFFDGLIIRKIK
jgi:hypothetical protein